MDLSFKKKKVIDEINQYFIKNTLVHNDQVANLLIRIDPKFRGLFLNPALLKKLKIEINLMMNMIAVEFSEFLQVTCDNYKVKTSSVISIARSMLKNHQKLVIRHLLSIIRQKNPKLANNLSDRLDQFPDLVLPSIRKNNAAAFARNKTSNSLVKKILTLLNKISKHLIKS